MAKLQRGGPRPVASRPTQKSDIVMSDDLTGEQLILSIHAPRKYGKTTLAASASSKTPAAWPPTSKGKKLTLDDMLWLSFDNGATDCLTDRGVRVASVSWNRLMQDGLSPIQATARMLKNAETWINSNRGGWLVVDTVTTFGGDLQTYWEQHAPDKWKKWEAVFEAHHRFHQSLKFLSPRIIYLFHSKDKIPDDDKGKKNQKATRAPGGSEIVPALAGQGINCYLNDSSLILTMMAKKVIGKKGELDRSVLTRSHDDTEAGTRFDLSLSAVEEPHLGKMLKKIGG